MRLIFGDRETPEHKSASCTKLACSLVTELKQIDSQHLFQQKDLFMYLISSCLDPNTMCEKAGHILGCPAKNDDHAPLIKALLEHSANLDMREANGKTVRDSLKAFWDYDSRPEIKSLIENK